MADLLFLFHHVKVMADNRLAESMRLVECQALDLVALPMFGVPFA